MPEQPSSKSSKISGALTPLPDYAPDRLARKGNACELAISAQLARLLAPPKNIKKKVVRPVPLGKKFYVSSLLPILKISLKLRDHHLQVLS